MNTTYRALVLNVNAVTMMPESDISVEFEIVIFSI
jgi:hypothetical protein